MDGLTSRLGDGGGRLADAHTAANTRPPRLLLTVEEAAERIGICRAYMFKLIRQGDVRSVKVGRLRRVTLPPWRISSSGSAPTAVRSQPDATDQVDARRQPPVEHLPGPRRLLARPGHDGRAPTTEPLTAVT
jgi:excisionase family DNA binding protein